MVRIVANPGILGGKPKALWLEILKRQPVYAELPAVAYYNRNTLDQFCVSTIGSIDKNYLTPARKLLR